MIEEPTDPQQLGEAISILEDVDKRIQQTLERSPLVKVVPVTTRRWLDVGYRLTVVMQQQVGGLHVVQIPKGLVGRALGIRYPDNKVFFSTVMIPWTCDEDFNWQKMAKKRLDTFLLPECQCESHEADMRFCEFHEKLNKMWKTEVEHSEKRQTQIKQLEEQMPIPGREWSGPADMLRILHRDYPWVRLDVEASYYVCLVCKKRRQFYPFAADRNVFLRDHSHCGMKPDEIIPPSFEDKVISKIGSLMEEEFRRTGSLTFDTARSFVLNLKGHIVIER
jgi:hypothetical protein